MCMDLSSAYDLIDVDIFRHKLKFYRVNPKSKAIINKLSSATISFNKLKFKQVKLSQVQSS